MTNKMKEEEKNEKIIRGLLKLPANKRCINCNSLGPQYVCITFWSFICTNCSGLHREFTHRVKSISMAKFTSQEVNALQVGGNERARQIYFKEWDPRRHFYPDSSHLDRLRDFIKQVYVDRRYAGGKNIAEPPRLKGERDEYDENQSFKTDRSGSRSPPYSDPYEKHFGERPGSARSDDRNTRFNYDARSLGYDQGDHKSPNRFETRDEIPLDDKAGNDVQSPKSNKSRTSEEFPKPGVSDHQKSVYISSPPMVRPVRDILGGNIPSLLVGELPNMNGGKALNSPSETQRSTSIKGPNNGNSVELKRVNSGSLIDFSADYEPPASGVVKEFVPPQTGSTPANGGGWASFDISSQLKSPVATSTAGDLESVFAQLFVNAPTPVVAPASPPAASTNSLPISNNSGQWPSVQQQPSSFQVSNHSINPPVLAPVGSLNKHVPEQLVGPSFPSSVQGAMTLLDGQPSHPVMHLSHQRTDFGNSQNSIEAEASGRKELPADLFTGVYPTSASYPAWRMEPHHGMTYRMQYPVMLPATYDAAKLSSPTFHAPVSTNPFVLGNESASPLNPVISSSVSLQAVAPNNPLSSTSSSNFSAVPLQWIPQQQLPYPPSAFPGPYMIQQFPYDIARQSSTNFFPAANQVGVGSEAIPYGASNSSQPPARTNSSVPSTGGNPFG